MLPLVEGCSSLDVLPCFELEQWLLCAPRVLPRSGRVQGDNTHPGGGDECGDSLKCLCHHHRLLVRPSARVISLATPPKSHYELLLLPLFLRAILCLSLSLIPGKLPQGKWSRSLEEEKHSFCLFACMLYSALVAVGTGDSTGLWHPF